MWVEDENGDAPAKVQMKTKTRALIGSWHDVHDKPITFNARHFHPHMWALTACTPRAFLWMKDDDASRLASLDFPLPSK